MGLVAAFRTVAPTMNLQCAYAISLNVLVRYGVNADVNGDGEISPAEWAALDKILKDQNSDGVTPNHDSELLRGRIVAVTRHLHVHNALHISGVGDIIVI